MADDDIKIKVAADVKQAVDSLKALEESLGGMSDEAKAAAAALAKAEAETAELDKATEKARAQSEDFASALGTITIAAGAAFASLVAGATKAFHAFAEADKSSRELRLALQNQGIAGQGLAKDYEDMAKAISSKTGVDDDALVAGQAILQNFLGQKEITPELTQALADLSIKTGSVSSAADLLGKGILGNTRGLKQYSIEIDANLSQTERLAAITRETTRQLGGLAEATNSGSGSIVKAKIAFQNFLEAIGERLSPIIEAASEKIAAFFNNLNQNEALLDIIFELATLAGLILGTITGLSSLGFAFVKISSALKVAQTAITLFGNASRLAVGATGLGLILIVAAEIALHWNSIWPVMVQTYQLFVGTVVGLSKGFSKLISGYLKFDTKLITEGGTEVLKVIENTQKGVVDIYKDTFAEKEDLADKEGKQDEKKAKLAEENAKKRAAVEQNLVDTRQAQRELDLLQSTQASTAAIELKKKEIETLKNIAEADSAETKARLQASLEETYALERDQGFADLERRRALHEELLANDENFRALGTEAQAAFLKKNEQILTDNLLTEKTAKEKVIKDDLKAETDRRNKQLENTVKHGAAVAAIEAILDSEKIKGVQQTTGQLVGLQNSRNSALKAIGKAAAISDIAIRTATGAIAAYNGFITSIPFPPVSIPLGIAAAAAVVAYGAEQIGNVLSAQTGGVVPGFNSGGDSHPAILQAGELVVPRQNFDEVISSVAASRAQQSVQSSSGVSTPSGSTGNVGGAFELRFSGDNAEKFLTARRVEARSLGTLREATA